MSLLHNQANVSGTTPMPTDRIDDSNVVNTSSAETVVWSYLNSGAWAAASGQAAGTICTAKLTYSGVLNSIGSALGSFNDTSLSWAAATRVSTLVTAPDELLSQMVNLSETDQVAKITPYLASNGDYIIDHRRGQIWMKSKASVANDAATYKYGTPITGGSAGDKVDVIKIGGVSIIADDGAFTAGTSTGIPAFALADETATDSVDEGDIGALRMTLNRRLITSSHYADDTAWATGNYVTAIGGYADEASTDSVDEGDYGTLRMTLNRQLINTPRTTAGVDVLVVDDVAQVAAPGMINVGGEYRATPTTYTDGDATILQTNVNGELKVALSSDIEIGAVELKDGTTDARQSIKVDNATASATPTVAIGGAIYKNALDTYDDNDASPLHVDVNGKLFTAGIYAEDAAHTTADWGIQGLAVRNDVLASLCDTDGDYTPLQVDANGALYVTTEASQGTAPQAYGIDAAGADTYTTVVTASATSYHMSVSLQGSNDAIVSLDSGVTDHFYIPANSSHVFDNILIANAATVQGKNAVGGSNYTNLAITIW